MIGAFVNGFPCKLAALRVERYRGGQPRPILVGGDEMHDEIKAALGNGTVDLVVHGPQKAGAEPGDEQVAVKGLIVDRLIHTANNGWLLIMYDARYLLGTRVNPVNLMMKFAGGYLSETNLASYAGGIDHVALRSHIMTGKTARSAVAALNQVFMEDDIQLAEYGLPDALSYLADRANADLIVTLDGKYDWATREDINGSSKLPGKNDYPWASLPGWVNKGSTFFNLPKELRVYSTERHCIRLQGADPQASISHSEPVELRVELTQVYAENGTYYTLNELLVAFGYGSGAITDADIARLYTTETMQGSAIERDGSDNNMRLLRAIKADWRKLWRIDYTDTLGNVGGWTDFKFGTLNEDGTVNEDNAVDCDWVEFLQVISPNPNYIGSEASKNHDGPAPFIADWDAGPEKRVIRLKQIELPDKDNIAYPGALVEPLKIEVKNSIEDSEGVVEILKNLKVIERADISKAKFNKSFTIDIFVCATRRMPNDESKWHVEKVPAFPAGSFNYQEMPPGEVLCYRDYTKPGVAGHDAQADGLGPVLNDALLKQDGERRAEVWKLTHVAQLDSEGIAEGIAAFRDIRLDGPIKEIVMEMSEGVVRTRVVAGNLADARVRGIAADKRIAKRKQEEAGKVVV